ncbi:MAG TPA: hypothetical protein VEZ11_06000 [Thermoanaerobaculia bacterium]|nr:hypothetical protein [Thermoanaerobaculia bacterium]
MKRLNGVLAVLVVSSFLPACSTSKPVDLKQPRRVVATENGVRIDVEIDNDQLSANSVISLSYTITNERKTAIAIAEIMPESSYDPETQTVTVSLGTEVPGMELLPRLQQVNPGDKKSFATAAHVSILVPQSSTAPFIHYPRALQVKINFINDTAPFAQLIGIPERAVHDRSLAAALFPKWMEATESLVTNAIPMRWQMQETAAPEPRRRRRP